MYTVKQQLFQIFDEYFEQKKIKEIDLIEDFYNLKGVISQKIIRNGKLIGYFIALNKNAVGFSACNPLDKFDKEYAKKLAFYRAQKCENPWKTIIPSLHKDLMKFMNRVDRYYK